MCKESYSWNPKIDLWTPIRNEKAYNSEAPYARRIDTFAEMIPSKYIENAVNEMASLPGVGRKTALRYVLELLGRSEIEVERFAESIKQMRERVMLCERCKNISDERICGICSNARRESQLICVVEDIRDLMALEATQQYQGLYHVLGGKISPMDGIGPGDLHIASLLQRLKQEEISELIFALSPTMEGDTTAYYIYRKIEQQLSDSLPHVSTLTRGLAIGDELQYADEITLGRSILHRTPYDQSMQG